MIFFGYLGLGFLVGVSSALLVVVANRATPRVRLFLRCLRWGGATGAVTGAVLGAMVVAPLRPGLFVGGLVYGPSSAPSSP